ncbi:hypothetical protein [Spirosoma rhododendri]|uniref:Uncharacterized protein n=1 Tax=Spirosoma rhododendri TaxID=2728024 RepID=A0A7L5DQP4_9BACT|nr:hypothetical protein [Spirosoma rhododendri]QJD79553.1 hypothetical protein HH216_14875 [Spirosoma rhododendri]
MTEQDYIDYFTDLATKNLAIGHTPDRPRFYVIHDNNMSELTNAMRNLRVPALLIDQYYDDIDRTQDNPRLRISGGLNVLVKCNTGDTKDVRRAREEARQIARQFLNRMFNDSRTPGSVLCRQGRAVTVSTQYQGEPMADMQNYAGWGYPFEWTVAQNVAVVNNEWDDLRPKPAPEPEPVPAPQPAPVLSQD